jgi:hypothetical protein
LNLITHFIQGGITAYPVKLIDPTAFIITAAVFGGISVVPDLYGEYKARVKKDGYAWYNSAHYGKINKYMRWFPGWGLHTKQDSFLHTIGKRWWIVEEWLWYEVMSVYLDYAILLLIFKNF